MDAIGDAKGASWRVETADRMTVVVDADDYFARAREALLLAKRRIMLIGWDFDARIALTSGELLPDEPRQVGEFLYWLVEREPQLELYLLRWDLGALKTIFRPSTLATVIKWMRHPRIHTKLDGKHPPGASHHQKLVSIDDSFAFCGGIDVTAQRWDTRAHCDDDPGRITPGGAPYQPWHDATVALSGPVAAALGELCRGRWHRTTGHRLKPVPLLPEHDCNSLWPRTLPPQFTNVPVAIARTQATVDDDPPVHEIERLFLAQIASAKRWIYCESQYFASRRIAEAIARRLGEDDGPEIVILNPITANGWLEPIAMDNARARLMEALAKRDRFGRLRMYHPCTAAGHEIYVHAKITIVDDRQLRVGSANLNNRSMRLDTECDILLDATTCDDPTIPGTIAALRTNLIAEHLGVDPAQVAESIAVTGSIIATIEALRGEGRTLRPYVQPEVNALAAWLADNEVLDPEGPGEMFELPGKRGLFRRRRLWRRRRRRTK